MEHRCQGNGAECKKEQRSTPCCRKQSSSLTQRCSPRLLSLRPHSPPPPLPPRLPCACPCSPPQSGAAPPACAQSRPPPSAARPPPASSPPAPGGGGEGGGTGGGVGEGASSKPLAAECSGGHGGAVTGEWWAWWCCDWRVGTAGSAVRSDSGDRQAAHGDWWTHGGPKCRHGMAWQGAHLVQAGGGEVQRGADEGDGGGVLRQQLLVHVRWQGGRDVHHLARARAPHADGLEGGTEVVVVKHDVRLVHHHTAPHAHHMHTRAVPVGRSPARGRRRPPHGVAAEGVAGERRGVEEAGRAPREGRYGTVRT
ncbi:unnamed protein product [Closterium sp. NIES-54]